jgi:hypothetical protein
MTNNEQSRKAFENEFNRRGYSIKRQEAGYIYEHPETEFASRGYESGWQASRQQVIAEIDNQELEQEIGRIINTSTVRGSKASAILYAIKTKLGE